eukprot:765496-Hanusia_phi.AAC.10
MVLLLIITVIIVPYELAFQEFACNNSIDPGQLILLWLIDACFWMDIILNFRTALIVLNPLTSKSEVIIDQRTIAVRYLKFWFWFDAVGSLPIQIIESKFLNTSCSFSAVKALRFNRLVPTHVFYKFSTLSDKTACLQARLVRLFRIIKLLRFSRWTFMLTKMQGAGSTLHQPRAPALPEALVDGGNARAFHGMLRVRHAAVRDGLRAELGVEVGVYGAMVGRICHVLPSSFDGRRRRGPTSLPEPESTQLLEDGLRGRGDHGCGREDEMFAARWGMAGGGSWRRQVPHLSVLHVGDAVNGERRGARGSGRLRMTE